MGINFSWKSILTSELKVSSPKLHLVTKLFFSEFYLFQLFLLFSHICILCFNISCFAVLASVDFHVSVFVFVVFKFWSLLNFMFSLSISKFPAKKLFRTWFSLFSNSDLHFERSLCLYHYSFRTFRRLWGRKYVCYWEEKSLRKSWQKSQKIADPGGDEKRKKLGRFLTILVDFCCAHLDLMVFSGARFLSKF